ncbi:membrane protein [Pilimelia terevasa]|uniref:Membrane protein n=2 Tax=Pilimelia terevasa TaxID=53372 RepID=A0A8J3FH63_9ACTN|nr:membrane protein [Pilimelia terevasa]
MESGPAMESHPALRSPTMRDPRPAVGPVSYPGPYAAPAGQPAHLTDVAAGHYAHPAPVGGRFDRWLDRWRARIPRWTAPLAVLSCLAAAAGYVLAADPTDGRADAVPSCLLKYTTGLDCPGCGGTRAFFYLLHGQLGPAARHHLLFVLAAPLLVYVYAAWALRLTTGRQLPRVRFAPWGVSVLLGVALVFSVARNLPWAPFTWLYV